MLLHCYNSCWAGSQMGVSSSLAAGGRESRRGAEGQEGRLEHGHGHLVGVGDKRRDDTWVTAFREASPQESRLWDAQVHVGYFGALEGLEHFVQRSRKGRQVTESPQLRFSSRWVCLLLD